MTTIASSLSTSEPRRSVAGAGRARSQPVDLAVIGGGIVGLAVAHTYLERHPGHAVVVLEKESRVARHQSGHNSGVLHSGIYYKPGSAKALNCIRGRALMERFCREQDVPFETCGKVIVATRERELPQLNRLYERGNANGVCCQMLKPGRLREVEPHARGLAALHVPDAGITDYSAVCAALARCITEAGGQIVTDAAVRAVAERDDMVTLQTLATTCRAALAVNCAGLHSDRIARLAGLRLREQIVPFRGEYYKLTPAAQHLCRNLIYPVPDSSFPFLGVHFTRLIGGGVECGPNAVLALAREGYRWRDFERGDVLQTVASRAFWAMAARHWRTGAGELVRSASKAAFVFALRRLVPEVRADHLVRAGAGVRAQALGRDGRLLDDFLIRRTRRMVHVLNAPSPAATSALAIAETVLGADEPAAPLFERPAQAAARPR